MSGDDLLLSIIALPDLHPDRTPHAMQSVHVAAKALLDYCDRMGLVLTIEQRPLQPLAMGHYETTVAVRPVLART